MRDKAAGLPLVIAPEVAAALAERHPVVALESTIVSHGMPYPDNLAMAQTVERIVHDHGVDGRNIEPGLDDCRGEQHIRVPVEERHHDAVEF